MEPRGACEPAHAPRVDAVRVCDIDGDDDGPSENGEGEEEFEHEPQEPDEEVGYASWWRQCAIVGPCGGLEQYRPVRSCR